MSAEYWELSLAVELTHKLLKGHGNQLLLGTAQQYNANTEHNLQDSTQGQHEAAVYCAASCVWDESPTAGVGHSTKRQLHMAVYASNTPGLLALPPQALLSESLDTYSR